MSRTLIVIGLVIVALGVLWPYLSRWGFGRLPGDIMIQRGNFTFYAPFATSLLVSILLTLALWLFRR